MSHSLFNVACLEEYARIREVLRGANYHEKGLIEVLGPIQLPTRPGRDLPHLLYLTKALRPVDILIRLFVIGSPVDVALAAQAVAPMSVPDWARAGLLEIRDGTARGRVRLMPFRGMLLACDYTDLVEPAERLDQVMGLTESSVALADFTVRRPVRSVLDLGTGGGVQALLAAGHSQQVVGVDRNPRAVEFARFNAGLNGVVGCEFVEGDTFEPVRGRKFDLVVSNPPFAITPSIRYLYRDSGRKLDAYCRNLVRQAPEFLNEGGMLQMCCDWVHLDGHDWKKRLSEWFDGSGCDAWILRTGTHTVADYARVWVRDTEYETDEASARLFNEWVSYYEAEGVEAISSGLIAMRRASGRANWLRIEELPAGSGGPMVSDAVVLGFRLRDYLETVHSDEALLAARLRVSPLVRLEDSCTPSAGAWRVDAAHISIASGITYSSPVDLRLAGLIARCDGQRTVRELIAGLAAATNSDLNKITPNCLSLLRELVERGLLLPDSLNPPAEVE